MNRAISDSPKFHMTFIKTVNWRENPKMRKWKRIFCVTKLDILELSNLKCGFPRR